VIADAAGSISDTVSGVALAPYDPDRGFVFEWVRTAKEGKAGREREKKPAAPRGRDSTARKKR
jgi:hypothetical protein